jgi:hypothetical protein
MLVGYRPNCFDVLADGTGIFHAAMNEFLLSISPDLKFDALHHYQGAYRKQCHEKEQNEEDVPSLLTMFTNAEFHNWPGCISLIGQRVSGHRI